ncbi:MAG TPA: hypothetical protein VEB86_00595, partial [Chryseosolibacter sp.]|nr:hypothetical protein [Chryseosolibacter sp.]
MRSLTLFIASLVMWTSGLAQELVTFEEISFSSDVEKNAFEKHFIERNTDYFRLFMASGSLTESAIARARADFYNQLASLNTDKFKSRKNEKKARAIHDAFSTAYLKKFDPNARFEDLFTSGAFSSLSAAMLFGLALHELQIPYAVREQPENVYVMAYPASEKVVMENPAISLGAFTVSHEMKVHFVKSLKDQKVISAQEYASSGVETLFDKYYFANHRDLTFLEMAGLQYTYEGFARSAEDKPKEALFEFEKAHMLYPSERTVYLLMSAGLSAFTAHEKRDQVHATLLAKVARYKTSGITDEMIVGEFYKVIQHLLFDSGQKDKLEAYYQVLDSLMVNESLKSELAFLYNYENGRYLYNQARYKEAQSFFERALARKPADQNSIGAFINILIQTKSTSDNFSRMSAL